MCDPTLVGEENETTFIRVWKPLLSKRVLKTMRGSLKMTISASGGLGPLQMVSEPDTERCASEEVEPRRGQCPSKDARPRKGVDWEVPHRLEKRTSASVPAMRLILKGGGHEAVCQQGR